MKELSLINTFVAIDPGKSGGIIIESKGIVYSYKMPDDITKLDTFFKENIVDPESTICFIEQLSMWRGGQDTDGKQFQINKMLIQYEQIKSALTLNKVFYMMVAAQSWQKGNNLYVKGSTEEKADRKRRYKVAAAEWYPAIDVTLNNCDALLIHRFLKLKMAFDQEWITIRRDSILNPKPKKKTRKRKKALLISNLI